MSSNEKPLKLFEIQTTRRAAYVLACTPEGAKGVFLGRLCTCGESHRVLDGKVQDALAWAHGECLDPRLPIEVPADFPPEGWDGELDRAHRAARWRERLG